MIDSAVTLLPEPDSPTMATVSRGAISKEMPLTTVVHTPSTRNAVVRSRTASTGAGPLTSVPKGRREGLARRGLPARSVPCERP